MRNLLDVIRWVCSTIGQATDMIQVSYTVHSSMKLRPLSHVSVLPKNTSRVRRQFPMSQTPNPRLALLPLATFEANLPSCRRQVAM